MARASALFDADDRRMLSAIKNIDRQLLHVQGTFAKFAGVATGALGLIGAGSIIKAGWDGVAKSIDLGDELNLLSAQTGIAVDDLVRLRKEFKNSGKEAADIGPVMTKMLKAIGSGSAQKTLADLGLSLEEIRKLGTADQFYAIGQAINGLATPSERATAAMEIFGKTGSSLLLMFSDSSFGQAAQEVSLQAKLLKQDAALFDETSDQMRMAGEKLNGFYLGIADKVAPILMQTLKAINASNATSIGSDVGEAIAAMLESFADGSIVKIFGLQLLDALTWAINSISQPFTGLAEGLAFGLLQAGSNFIALLMDGVAQVLDYLAKAPGMSGLSKWADSLRQGAEQNRGSVWGMMNAGAERGMAHELSWTKSLRMTALDAMSAEYAKANKRQQDALASVANAPAAPGGESAFAISAPNVSALARIGGAFGAGGGDPLLEENRRQTSVLEKIAANTARFNLPGVPLTSGSAVYA